MTPDELKSLPNIVYKTDSHPIRTKLKLFLKWDITFEESYEIEEGIIRRYMCRVDEELESAKQNIASKSGSMLQSQMNETVAKVRQSLRTED